MERRGASGRRRRGAVRGRRRGRGRTPGLGLRYAALTYIKFSLCTSGKQLVLEETIIKENIKTKRVPDQWMRPGVRAARRQAPAARSPPATLTSATLLYASRSRQH